MIKVDFNIVVKASRSINLLLINKVASLVAKELKAKEINSVSLALVGDQLIKGLNRQYRKKNKVTDVLSFVAADGKFVNPEGSNFLGEIIISYPQLVRQAKGRGVSIRQEFSLLFVHGLVHLFGYDHETSSRDSKFTDSIQTKVLAQLGFKKNLVYN